MVVIVSWDWECVLCFHVLILNFYYSNFTVIWFVSFILKRIVCLAYGIEFFFVDIVFICSDIKEKVNITLTRSHYFPQEIIAFINIAMYRQHKVISIIYIGYAF